MEKRGMFEHIFGAAPTTFGTVEEVDRYVAERLGRGLRPVSHRDQNFAKAQGCVFAVESYDIDHLVDVTLKEGKCSTPLPSMK